MFVFSFLQCLLYLANSFVWRLKGDMKQNSNLEALFPCEIEGRPRGKRKRVRRLSEGGRTRLSDRLFEALIFNFPIKENLRNLLRVRHVLGTMGFRVGHSSSLLQGLKWSDCQNLCDIGW